MHFLTFGAREDEGVWGYEHIACTNVQEALNNDVNIYSAGISKAIWCGCPEFENISASQLYRFASAVCSRSGSPSLATLQSLRRAGASVEKTKATHIT